MTPEDKTVACVVLTKAMLRAAHRLGLPLEAVARIIGPSEASLSRMAAGQRHLKIGTKPAELASLLIRLNDSLDALVGGSDRQRLLWMTSYNQAFHQPPRDAIERVEGLFNVVRYLDSALIIT
jgi:hypothetical protein